MVCGSSTMRMLSPKRSSSAYSSGWPLNRTMSSGSYETPLCRSGFLGDLMDDLCGDALRRSPREDAEVQSLGSAERIAERIHQPPHGSVRAAWRQKGPSCGPPVAGTRLRLVGRREPLSRRTGWRSRGDFRAAPRPCRPEAWEHGEEAGPECRQPSQAPARRLGKPAKSAALDDLRPRHHRATEGGRTSRRLDGSRKKRNAGTLYRQLSWRRTIGAVEQYVIRGGAAGYDRLRILARARWPDTSDLLARVGLRSGMRCLDLGCGGGEVTFEIARLVGQDGCVTGVDMDEAKLSSPALLP